MCIRDRVRAEQQLARAVAVKVAQQPAGRLVVVVHGQEIVAEVGLRLACAGAPQADVYKRQLYALSKTAELF